MNIIEVIISFQSDNRLFKYEHIIKGINESIAKDELKVGNQLPSLNIMVKKLGYSSDTILKGYRKLEDMGLVESVKNKGYFIINNKDKVLSE
ncbi:GntR family transcriptional regulator [uncultured Maribacter sp.]|uniref:GntR family transcriptional regulator n=1 Tax=uncultured Maribacter sp. TaxID=431308 RepID=UPI0026206DBA|nr:winged helix-turn-helix domain-containing protein [uncultured Maribacter sp.]